jgi:hypothetical protein
MRVAPLENRLSRDRLQFDDHDADRFIVTRVLKEPEKRSTCDPFHELSREKLPAESLFWAARSSPKSKKIASNASASTPVVSHTTSTSPGSLLVVTKLPPTKTRGQPAPRSKRSAASSFAACSRR